MISMDIVFWASLVMFHHKDPAVFAAADAEKVRSRVCHWRNVFICIGLIVFLLGMLVWAQWTRIHKDLFMEEQARCEQRFTGKRSFLWLRTGGCLVMVDGAWVHESQMPK